MFRIFLIILLLKLSACGFQVIYKERENVDISYVDELAAIRIQKVRTKLAQEFQNNLYDILNPDYVKAEPKYLLVTTVKSSIIPVFITATGASGRNKMTLDVTYELKSIETGTTVGKGFTSVYDNYDVSLKRYGTYAAEEYTKTNLTKVAAQDIRNSLVNDLIESKKEKEKKDDWLNTRPEPKTQENSSVKKKKRN
jgi:hypothetical protein